MFTIASQFGNPLADSIEFHLPVVQAYEETVEEKVKRLTSDIPELYFIVEAESNFNPEAQNPESTAKGLFQITDPTWKHFKCEGDPLNPDDNINCALKIFEERKWKPWLSSFDKWGEKIGELKDEININCSCMRFLTTKGIALKGNASEQVANSTPFIGGVVLFKYSTGADHAAYIERFTEDGMIISESNYYPCKKSIRKVYWTDPSIRGFLNPQ